MKKFLLLTITLSFYACKGSDFWDAKDKQEAGEAGEADEERVDVPKNVHGAYLTCGTEETSNQDGELFAKIPCKLADQSNQKLELARLGVNFTWSYEYPEESIAVEFQSGSESSDYHGQYLLKASSYIQLSNILKEIRFLVSYQDLQGQPQTVQETEDSQRTITREQSDPLITATGWQSQKGYGRASSALNIQSVTICRAQQEAGSLKEMGHVRDGVCRVAAGTIDSPILFERQEYDVYLDPQGEYKAVFQLSELGSGKTYHSINDMRPDWVGCSAEIADEAYFGQTWPLEVPMRCYINRGDGQMTNVEAPSFRVLTLLRD